MTFDQAVAFALTLPGAELSTSYGKPAVKVRGKGVLGIGREPGSFGVRATLEEVEMLKLTDPATFWQTPHYHNWPGLLVRYGSVERERIERVIARAWWDRTRVAGRKAYGARP